MRRAWVSFALALIALAVGVVCIIGGQWPPGLILVFAAVAGAMTAWQLHGPMTTPPSSSAGAFTHTDTSSPSAQAGRRKRRVGRLVIGIAVFAALMALRHELSSVWMRATVAACAFAVLALAVLTSRRAQ
jgi:hypothetical protein